MTILPTSAKWWLALAVLLVPSQVRGGPPTELEPGVPAPYAGTLVERGYLADLLRAEAQRDRARAETRGLKARFVRTEADLSAERAQREADRVEAERREAALDGALKRCEGIARESVRPASVWSSPYLWGTVGVVVGVVVGVGLAGAL